MNKPRSKKIIRSVCFGYTPGFSAVIVAGLSTCLLVTATGCNQRTTDAELLHTINQYWDDVQLDQARPFVREYLQRHPESPSAHFFLGLCHLFSRQDTRIEMAQGEFEFAHRLYKKTGRWQGVNDFASPEEFEAGLYREKARVIMKRIYDSPRELLTPAFMLEQYKKARALVVQGLALNPTSKPLTKMKKQLDRVLAMQV